MSTVLPISSRQSTFFTKTRKQAPSDEISNNARNLIRGGFIHKEMAGVYDFLPLGFRVLQNIHTVIRDEMIRIGGQEVLLSALQEKTLWEETDRWNDEKVDVWFKTAFKNKTETGLGWTHEEPVTRIMRDHISSYRDLPQYVFQIQTKFRNETRAKSGIMRTREFPMKDLYSFDRDQQGLDAFYEKVADAYMRIFQRVGLGNRTYKTFASGGAFSKFSHEFQTVSEAGEDIIYVDEKKNIAVNKEVYTDEILKELDLKKEELVEKKAIEVGNIFKLGNRFSDPLGLKYKDENGKDHPVIMGCYGIGPSRILGTVAEVCSDERGIIWPRSIAPYEVHLIRLGELEIVQSQANALFDALTENGVSVLYDDRDVRAGEKFADSDLIGIPIRVIVSEKTVTEGKLEIIERETGNEKSQTQEEFLEELS